MSGRPALTASARLAAALGGREPDRVPFFLPAGMHGALLLGVPLREYYGSADLVTRGQLRLHGIGDFAGVALARLPPAALTADELAREALQELSAPEGARAP